MVRYIFAIFNILLYINAPAQVPSSKHGTFERFENFPSGQISSRTVDVWLPDGYTEDNEYAVIYMQDGQMLFDSSYTDSQQEWKVDEVLTAMIEAGSIEPVIIVGIYHSDDIHAEYFPQKAFEILPEDIKAYYYPTDSLQRVNSLFPQGPRSDQYVKFVVEELKPFIDRSFSTKADIANTYIMGSSMGALISMYAMWEYPDVFGGAVCLSTHWNGGYSNNDNPIPAAFLHCMTNNMIDPSTHKVWFDMGTEGYDKLYVMHQERVIQAMIDAGFNPGQNLYFKVYEGADHDISSWSARLHEVFAFLLN